MNMDDRFGTCPACGLEIVCNDKTQTIAHEVPECSEFKAMLEKHQPDSTYYMSILHINMPNAKHEPDDDTRKN